MKIAIVVGFLMFATSIVSSKNIYDEIEEEWNLFKISYNKSYGDHNEDDFRKSVYLESKLKIETHNKLYENGEVSFTLGMNHFGDLTDQEFLERMTGFKPSLDYIDSNNIFVKSENVSYPNSVNWIPRGYVTPVKSQGICGSCWSFSVTGSIEGQYFRKTGKLISLSEQNLVDCTLGGKYGNHGCEGGDPRMALKYVKENGGIDTEKSYPYKGRENRRCQYDKRNLGAKISGYRAVKVGDANLMAAVATVGPVSVCITVVESFKLYRRGVYKEPHCGPTINHAMLAVGYGAVRNGGKYWLLKNSWGTTWGDKGYMYLSRNVANMCRVSDYVSFPTT